MAANKRKWRVAEESAPRAKRAVAKAASTALEEKLEWLRCQAHGECQLLDLSVQEAFAEHHTEYVLKVLKPRWQRDLRELALNAPLRKLAQERAPEVIHFIEARANILQLAEGLVAAPRTASSVGPGVGSIEAALEEMAWRVLVESLGQIHEGEPN